MDFWLPRYGILTFSTHVRRKRLEPLMILHHQGFSAPGLASIESSGPALSLLSSISSSWSSSAAQGIDHLPCHFIIIIHLRHLRHHCLSCPPFSSNYSSWDWSTIYFMINYYIYISHILINYTGQLTKVGFTIVFMGYIKTNQHHWGRSDLPCTRTVLQRRFRWQRSMLLWKDQGYA